MLQWYAYQRVQTLAYIRDDSLVVFGVLGLMHKPYISNGRQADSYRGCQVDSQELGLDTFKVFEVQHTSDL